MLDQFQDSAALCTSKKDAQALRFIIDLIYDRCRIRLHEGKETLIRARLGKRMRHHGLQSIAEYGDFLKQGCGPDEMTHVVDALTTNFTHFLREESHFKFLVHEALPTVLGSSSRQFHIWSAACATGEEPYSLGFYLSECFPLSAGWDWRIHASDISTKALGQARAGIYPADRLDALPKEWLRKFFQRGSGQYEGHFRIKPALAERVQFQQFNLIGPEKVSREFQVIFCRNVMIYFDRPTQEQVVHKLAEHLSPGGFLIVGHSESLTGLSSPLRCLKPSIYQKPHARTDSRRSI